MIKRQTSLLFVMVMALFLMGPFPHAHDTGVIGHPWRIAFACQEPGQEGIWIIDSDGRNARQLTTSAHTYYPSRPVLSPDGSHVAYGNAEGVFFVMDADGKNQRTLVKKGSIGWFAWSPDGKQMAFVKYTNGSSGNYRVYVIKADGSGEQELTSTDGDAHPAWSPDGKAIAYIPGSQNAVTVVDLNGKVVRLYPTPTRPFMLRWSTDGSRLFYSSYGSGKDTSLCSIDAASGRISKVLPCTVDLNHFFTPFEISPDARSVAVVSARLSKDTKKVDYWLQVADLKTKKARDIFKTGGAGVISRDEDPIEYEAQEEDRNE